MLDRENEYSAVTEPWSFDRLRAMQIERANQQQNKAEEEYGGVLGIEMQQSLPNMARLSLEEKKHGAAKTANDCNVVTRNQPSNAM